MFPEKEIAQLLTAQNKTLGVAESCTGGLLSSRLTDIPGSSAFFTAGMIVYSNDAKIKFLDVQPATLDKHGAVSEEVADQLAKGIQRKCQTDFGIGITGIAGPDGGSKRKPVGLVYIAVCTDEESLVAKCQFQGDRNSIKTQASTIALQLLLEFLDI